MASLSSLNVPVIRGEATIRVLGPDGQVKSEQSGKNLLNRRFWDGILTGTNTTSLYSSIHLFNIRTYIGYQTTVPHPYETTAGMLGEGTDHPQGVFAVGAEPITEYPYIQIRNLYQVTGTARTIYSIGLCNDTGIPDNDIQVYRNCVTRLLLPEPVVQGVNDQIDLIYRLYFEEDPNSPTHPAYWADLVYWAMTRSSNTQNGSTNQLYGGFNLGMGGIGYEQYRQSTNYPVQGVDRACSGPGWIRAIDNANVGAASPQYVGRNDTTAHYYFNQVFRTNKSYMVGELFNEWWPRDFGFDIRVPAWLGSQSGIQGNTIYQKSSYRLAKFHKDETTSTGPFHNSFNFDSTTPKLHYDIDHLPQTTWRAIFGGTWPTDDRYPLYARMVWTESGAVDGSSAKYKLNFLRTLGTRNGFAYDEVYGTRGQQLTGAADDGTTSAETMVPGQTYWSLTSDLANGHHEYPNSRFGNLGFYRNNGISGYYHHNVKHVFQEAFDSDLRCFNCRKVVGLTTNTWWGFQSGKYGKSNHLGVEWRKIYPFERKVWQKEDISSNLNQIDWLETVNGMPGEIDDEMCVITDKTSGVYLINATQDTVTQITNTTGLDQVTVTRDPSTGDLIYTGIVFRANDIDFYTSDNNWQLTPFFQFDRQVGGSLQLTNSQTPSEWFSVSPNGASIRYTSGWNWPNAISTDIKTNELKLQRTSWNYDGRRDAIHPYFVNADGSIQQNYFGLASDDDFTVEVWIKSSYFGSAYTDKPAIKLNSTFVLNTQTDWGFRIGDQYLPAFFTTEDYSDWCHIAVVRENGIITSYKNGAVHAVLEDEFGTPIVDTTEVTTGTYIGIGGQHYDENSYAALQGLLQQARITKAARYSGAFTPGDFTSTNASDDVYFNDTLLSLTSEKNPLLVTNAGTNLVNGNYDNLATTTSGDGTSLTVSVLVNSNAIQKVAVQNRGTNYRISDTVSVTIPTLPNPTYGAVLGLDQSSLQGGSGYDDGIYTVTMSGGSGDQNVQCQITVAAGVVTGVVVSETNAGTNYAVGDQLSASDSDLGGLGTGAGFSIEVSEIDNVTNLTSETIEFTIESIASKLDTWWTTYSGRTILIRRHWRFPEVFVGIFQSGSHNYSYYLDSNAGSASFDFGPAMQNEGTAYIGEFFGDQGENDSGITKVTLSGSNSYIQQRELAWPDWIQFSPDGMYARAIGLRNTTHTDTWFQKGCTLINTSRANFGSRYLVLETAGSDPWTAPHSILQIPNAENSSNPHWCLARRDNYSNSNYEFSRLNGYTPYIFKGGNRVTDPGQFEERGNVVSKLVCGNPDAGQNAGYYVNSWPTQGSAYAAGVGESTSTGVYKENGYERYKGLALDGMNVNFVAPMFTTRDAEDVLSDNPYLGSAWPIDPLNDEQIMHPLRWDNYGWDSANNVWVKEEWGYNYSEHRWEVDPSTVYPGRPAPNNGGTHSLSAVPDSPYNGLDITFNNVRPEDTNNPIQGEWSGQHIYNGCVFDGVTEFTFGASVSNRPITLKAISQTIPASGIIQIPEVYDDTYIWLFGHSDFYDLKIDGERVSYNMNLDYTLTLDEGTVAPKYYQLYFSPNDVGKTLTGTYPIVSFASSEAPANWVWWTASHNEAVDGTTTGLLGGYDLKDSATLVSEGWTLHSTGGHNRTIQASDFSTDFPNGFAYIRPNDPYTTETYFAEAIVINRQNIGFFWHDGASSLTYNRNFINDSNAASNPVYGGACWAYELNHYLVDIHTITYTDPSGDNWLIIRPQWYNNQHTDPGAYVVGEVWISVDDPYNYQMRFGRWDQVLFDDRYGGMNVGISWTGKWYGSTSTSMTKEYPNRWPYGAYGRYSYTSNLDYFTPWGGNARINYPNHTYEINLDPHDFEEPT